MKKLTCADEPIQVYGLLAENLPKQFIRLPQKLDAILPKNLTDRAKCPVGGRVRFRTNAPEVVVHMELETLSVDYAIPICGSAGAVAAVGTGTGMCYAGLVCPKQYDQKILNYTIQKAPVMDDVTIYLPRNEVLNDVWFEITDDKIVESPTPYVVEKPIVFYGSSITEGGCASRVTNAYPALLSKWLNADYINLGFSGSAKGEIPVAEFIAEQSMSAFVYDYDHNAPNPEHLAATHEAFFRVIREKHQHMPIIILSRPDTDLSIADAIARREIIFSTYRHAVNEGDRHVLFIDGQTFFGNKDRADCTVDGCHPNDLGFMRMAEIVYPVLKQMLL